MSTEHFTQALQLTHNFNPEVNPASRLAAEEYLMQLQNSTDGLNLSFHIISNEPVNEIRCFWAFNTILTHMTNIASTVNDNQAEELFKTLFSFIYRCFFSPTTNTNVINNITNTNTTTWNTNSFTNPFLNVNINNSSNSNNNINSSIILPAEYLLNKHAQVMAAGLHVFYPTRWSHFFDELFELLNKRVAFPHSSHAVTMYFVRVFEYIDEKVVIRVRELSERNSISNVSNSNNNNNSSNNYTNTNTNRIYSKREEGVNDNNISINNVVSSKTSLHSKEQDMAVKDAMRVHVIPKVVNIWYNILCEYQNTSSTFSNTNTNNSLNASSNASEIFSNSNNSNNNSNTVSYNSNNEIEKCTLNVLQTYIEWIDIRLCTTPEWVNLLFFLLISSNALRNAVLEVLISLVSKKQLPGMKMSVLATLNVCEMMPKLVGMITEQYMRETKSKKCTLADCHYCESNVPSGFTPIFGVSNLTGNTLYSEDYYKLTMGSNTNSSIINNNNSNMLSVAESITRLNIAVAEQFANLLDHLRNSNSNSNSNNNNNVVEDSESGFVLVDIPFEVNETLLHNLTSALHFMVESLLQLFQLNLSAEVNEFLLPFWQSYVKRSELLENEAARLLSYVFEHTLLSSFKPSSDNDNCSFHSYIPTSYNINITTNNINNNTNNILNVTEDNNKMFDEELITQRKSLYHLMRLLYRRFPDYVLQYTKELVEKFILHLHENSLHGTSNNREGRENAKMNGKPSNLITLPSEHLKEHNEETLPSLQVHVEAILRLVYELGEAVKLECLKDVNHLLTQLFSCILLHGETILAEEETNINMNNNNNNTNVAFLTSNNCHNTENAKNNNYYSSIKDSSELAIRINWSPYVHLAYFELIDRYYVFFTFHSEHIPRVLHHLLLLPSGILNKHNKVRSRICYFASHLMQLLKPWLAPLAFDVVQALRSIVTCNTTSISTSTSNINNTRGNLFSSLEKQQLYEAMGALLRLHVNTIINNYSTTTTRNNNNSVSNNVTEWEPVLHSIMKQIEEPINELLAQLEQQAQISHNNNNSNNNSKNNDSEKEMAEFIECLSALMKGIGSASLPSNAKLEGNNTVNVTKVKIQDVASHSSNSNNNNISSSNVEFAASLQEYVTTQLVTLFVTVMNGVLRVLEFHYHSSIIRERCGQFFHRLLNVTPFESIAAEFERYIVGTVQFMESVTELTKLLRLVFQCFSKINSNSGNNNIRNNSNSGSNEGELYQLVHKLTPLLWAKVQDVGVLVDNTLLESINNSSNNTTNISSNNNNNSSNEDENNSNYILIGKSSPLICMGVISDQARDKIEVYKQFCLLFFAIAAKSNGSQCIFALHHHLLNSILVQLLGAISLPGETELGKVSLQIFNKLLTESYSLLTVNTNNNNSNNSSSNNNTNNVIVFVEKENEIKENAQQFISFLHQSVLPFTLRLFTSHSLSMLQYKDFDLNDAKNFLLVGEFVLLCKSLVNCYGEATLQVIYSSLMGNVGDENAMKMCVLLRDATQVNAALKLHIRQVLLKAQRSRLNAEREEQ